MYALEQIAAEADAFRVAVRRLEGFRPLSVKLKVVDACNLSCDMCRHWQRPRRHELSLERLSALLEELAGLGCLKVHLTGGEPALRPDLEAIVAAGVRAGLRVTLTTNATLITRARARGLVEAGLRGVNVSIDSPHAELHDRQRGQRGALARAIEGTKSLRKEARHGKLGIAINAVVTRINWRSLVELPDLAARLGAETVRVLPVDDHAGVGLSLGVAEIAEFNRSVAPRIEQEARRLGLLAHAWPFGRASSEALQSAAGEHAHGYYRERPCYAPFTHALVDHAGRVFVCCAARGEPSLGDVGAGDFSGIWSGPAYREVRRAMLQPSRLPPCGRCDDYLEQNRRLQTIVDGAPGEAA